MFLLRNIERRKELPPGTADLPVGRVGGAQRITQLTEGTSTTATSGASIAC